MEDVEIKKKDGIMDEEEEEECRSMSTSLSKILKQTHDQKLHLEMPNLCEAFVVSDTMPFSSASCERSFSTLDIIKNTPRTTMTDERLDSLMKVCVNRAVLDGMKEKDLVEMFALKPRRIPL